MFILFILLIGYTTNIWTESISTNKDEQKNWELLSSDEVILDDESLILPNGAYNKSQFIQINTSDVYVSNFFGSHTGAIEVQHPIGTFSCKKAELTPTSENLLLYQAKGELNGLSYLCFAKEINLSLIQRESLFKKGYVTRCNKERPCWAICLSRISVTREHCENNRLFIKNPVFRIYNIPVFWLPYISLRQQDQDAFNSMHLESDLYRGHALVMTSDAVSKMMHSVPRFLKRKLNLLNNNQQPHFSSILFEEIDFKEESRARISFYFRRGIVPSYNYTDYYQQYLWNINVFTVFGGRYLSRQLDDFFNGAIRFNFLKNYTKSYLFSHYSFQTHDYNLYQFFRRDEYVETPSPTSWILYRKEFNYTSFFAKINYHLSNIQERIYYESKDGTDQSIDYGKRSTLGRLGTKSFIDFSPIGNQKLYLFNTNFASILGPGKNLDEETNFTEGLFRTKTTLELPITIGSQKTTWINSISQRAYYLGDSKGSSLKRIFFIGKTAINHIFCKQPELPYLDRFLLIPELSVTFSRYHQDTPNITNFPNPPPDIASNISSYEPNYAYDFLAYANFLEDQQFITFSNKSRLFFSPTSDSLRGLFHYIEVKYPLEGGDKPEIIHHALLNTRRLNLQYFYIEKPWSRPQGERTTYWISSYQLNNFSQLHLSYIQRSLGLEDNRENIKLGYTFDTRKYAGKIETMFDMRNDADQHPRIASQTLEVTKKMHCFDFTVILFFQEILDHHSPDDFDWSIRFRVQRINF